MTEIKLKVFKNRIFLRRFYYFLPLYLYCQSNRKVTGDKTSANKLIRLTIWEK